MTKQRSYRIKGLGLFLVLLMFASPVGSSIAFAATAETGQTTAGPANSTPQTTGESSGISINEDELVEVGDGVSVWDRAILPLRGDDDSAAHSSPNGEAVVRVEEEGIERSLNKPALSVYNTGTAIDLTFLPNRADAIPNDFDGGEVQLIAARIDGDQEFPRSQAELVDLATDNDAATFEMVDETTIDIHTFKLGGAKVDGDKFSFTPDDPGQYVLLLATPDGDATGFSVDDGDLSQSGNVTIIGMDTVAVQEEPSDVDAHNTVTRGNNVTFDVGTPGAADNSRVNHTIVLYDEKTFTGTSTTFTFETVSADADVSVSTDIKSINGEVYLINEPSVLNTNVSDSELVPPVSTTSIANAILADRSNVTVKHDAVQLDASLTAERTTPDAKIDVGTAENWSAGRYHWIHIATTADGSIVGSNSGDITVNNAGGGGNDGGHDDHGGRSNNDHGSAPVSIDVRTEDGHTTFDIENAPANKTIRLSPGTSGSGPANPTLTDLNVSFTKDTDAELGVNGDRGATPPVNPNADLGYFNITHEIPDDDIGNVTFSFTVAADRLADRGVAPEDVMLYRYHDGEWTALETRHLGTSDGVHQFEADSPGLSVFAVSTRNAQTATFEVTEASLNADSVEVGDSVEVTATVENTGGSEGTYTAELLVDGETVTQQDVTVPAGESETVSFTHTFDEAGSYDVTIGDTASGTVEVTAADTPTTTETPVPFLGGGSSAIIVLVLLVFAGAVALLYRSGRLDDLK